MVDSFYDEINYANHQKRKDIALKSVEASTGSA